MTKTESENQPAASTCPLLAITSHLPTSASSHAQAHAYVVELQHAKNLNHPSSKYEIVDADTLHSDLPTQIELYWIKKVKSVEKIFHQHLEQMYVLLKKYKSTDTKNKLPLVNGNHQHQSLTIDSESEQDEENNHSQPDHSSMRSSTPDDPVKFLNILQEHRKRPSAKIDSLYTRDDPFWSTVSTAGGAGGNRSTTHHLIDQVTFESCDICNVPFTTNLKLFEHKKAEHSIYTCCVNTKSCNFQEFSSLDDLIRHVHLCMKSSTGNSHKHPSTPNRNSNHQYSSSRSPTPVKSLYQNGTDSINKPSSAASSLSSCQVCNKKFANIQLLTKHLLTEHAGKKSTDTTPTKNGETLPTLQNLFQDQLTSASSLNEIICPHDGCNKGYQNVTAMMEHAKFSHRPVIKNLSNGRKRCEICVKSVPLDQLEHHIQTEHPNMDSLVQCTTCYQFFPNSGSLARHMLIHKSGAPVIPNPVTSNNGVSGQKRELSTQDDEDKSLGGLANKIFIGQNGQKIHTAGGTFSPSSIASLLENSLGKTNPLTESSVKNEFDNNIELNTTAGGILNACETCGDTFTSMVEFKNHLRKHYLDTQRRYECSVCNKSFTTLYNLKAHMGIHSGKKPFTCSFCNKAFLRKYDMQRHERHHTGDKPFKCNNCGKAFIDRGSLKKHSRTTQCYQKISDTSLTPNSSMALSPELQGYSLNLDQNSSDGGGQQPQTSGNSITDMGTLSELASGLLPGLEMTSKTSMGLGVGNLPSLQIGTKAEMDFRKQSD